MKEVKKISKNYNLGYVNSIKVLEGGYINYNFELKTTQGNFIIRILGKKMTEVTKKKLKKEFYILNYLSKTKFPCQIPLPLKNKHKKYISCFKNRYFWIYKKIEGKVCTRINKKKFFQIAMIVAEYNKLILDIELDKNDKFFPGSFFDLTWLIPQYDKMENIKPKDKLDILVYGNLAFFKKLAKNLSRIDYDKKIIFTHSDFHKGNFLFKKNEFVGLLDFDNLETAPHIKNIISAVRNNCIKNHKLDKRLFNLFLKSYRKVSKLSEVEEKLIIPGILREICISYWWFYEKMEKAPEKKYPIIKENIQVAKNLIRFLK
jgi:Ser/Thr protein kinase RdoA (MazF antagonist)